MKSVQLLLIVEAVSFAVAAAFHFGLLVAGYEHMQARLAEMVIASVLTVALVVSLMRSELMRGVAIAAQGFALLGTLVGVFTIFIGVGPRTLPDVGYHVAIIAILVCGLFVAIRTPRQSRDVNED